MEHVWICKKETWSTVFSTNTISMMNNFWFRTRVTDILFTIRGSSLILMIFICFLGCLRDVLVLCLSSFFYSFQNSYWFFCYHCSALFYFCFNFSSMRELILDDFDFVSLLLIRYFYMETSYSLIHFRWFPWLQEWEQLAVILEILCPQSSEERVLF